MKDSINVAIAGATGYIGLELVKILSKHNKVNIKYLCANKSAGKSIKKFDKSSKKPKFKSDNNLSKCRSST